MFIFVHGNLPDEQVAATFEVDMDIVQRVRAQL